MKYLSDVDIPIKVSPSSLALLLSNYVWVAMLLCYIMLCYEFC
jgi:hypothetical protein